MRSAVGKQCKTSLCLPLPRLRPTASCVVQLENRVQDFTLSLPRFRPTASCAVQLENRMQGFTLSLPWFRPTASCVVQLENRVQDFTLSVSTKFHTHKFLCLLEILNSAKTVDVYLWFEMKLIYSSCYAVYAPANPLSYTANVPEKSVACRLLWTLYPKQHWAPVNVFFFFFLNKGMVTRKWRVRHWTLQSEWFLWLKLGVSLSEGLLFLWTKER